MARHLVNLEAAPVPVLRHTDNFIAAAADLATSTCAYVVPEQVKSPYAPVTSREQKVALLVGNLNLIRPTWMALDEQVEPELVAKDIGMHGNFSPALTPLVPDCIHYHATPQSSVRVTFARARPAYHEDMSKANAHLTEALRDGKIDTRYADPATVMQADVHAGEAVAFRLNDPNPPYLSYLHDFLTVGDEPRTREIVRIVGTPLMPGIEAQPVLL